MKQNPVIVELSDQVGIVRINRPEVLNAFNPETIDALSHAIVTLVSDQNARSILLTGEGRAFSSGADLSDSGGKKARPPHRGNAVLQQYYHPLIRIMRDCPVPIVTAVNGAAVGAGMSIALMGDIITASSDAYFLQAFRHIGFVPDCAATWMLPRLIGIARARELSLMAQKLPAETALDWGMINRVYPAAELMAESMKIAVNLADGPVKALGKTRKLYWESGKNSLEEQLNLEDEYQFEAAFDEEFLEGVAAFSEKRKPDFRKL